MNEMDLYATILDRFFAASVQSAAHDRVDDGPRLSGGDGVAWVGGGASGVGGS
jgi:hypothetical protein